MPKSMDCANSRNETQTWVAIAKKENLYTHPATAHLHTFTFMAQWFKGNKHAYCFCIDWVADIAIRPSLSLKSKANMVIHNDFSQCGLNFICFLKFTEVMSFAHGS